VHRLEWDRSDPSSWHRKFKNEARLRCTGDWCILLDCDEFIPEWEFDRLRRHLEATPKDILPVRFVHFYANYKVYMAALPTIVPEVGYRIHRNRPEIEVWGDGANVSFGGRPHDVWTSDEETFTVHHFGSVREPSRLRQKWRIQAKQHDEAKPRWDRVPAFLFNLFPHKWSDPAVIDSLAVYEGPFIQAVRDDPDEFVRDRFATYNTLKKRG
jgi:hypothetical protein